MATDDATMMRHAIGGECIKARRERLGSVGGHSTLLTTADPVGRTTMDTEQDLVTVRALFTYRIHRLLL